MDKRRSTYTTSVSRLGDTKRTSSEISAKARGDCDDLDSSSHTQYFKQKKYKQHYDRITSDEYLGEPPSSSSTTCTRKYKQYKPEELRERLFRDTLDPVVSDRNWTEGCAAPAGGEAARALEFLLGDAAGRLLTDRIQAHIRDLAKSSRFGYSVEVLHCVCVVLDYLVEDASGASWPSESLLLLADNIDKPILLHFASDINTHFGLLEEYIGFLGYFLLRVGEGELFVRVSRGVAWQLSGERRAGGGAVQARHVLATSRVLLPTVPRMIALARPSQFAAYHHIAFLLACDSVQNCIEMIKENIIENILYRFNPYFPDNLPGYESTPADPQDINIKLGDSSIHMSTTLSLLLVLLKTLMTYLDMNPEQRTFIPCPDYDAQRCFVWVYRYECRARDHHHERTVLTVIAQMLLHCYGDRLTAFSVLLMPGILTLSVRTEVPPRQDWTSSVHFRTTQADVYFKKLLISLSVDFLRIFRHNNFMVESQHWLLGLMFLIDPGLSSLRVRWSPALYSEIRLTALQALVCTLPLIRPPLVQQYDVIRRLIWYIEWYSESPFELPLLYWCVRALQTSAAAAPATADDDLLDTHATLIITHLMYTLLEQRCPPVERGQAVLGAALQVVVRAAARGRRLACRVYPHLQWPASLNALAADMLRVALHSLDQQWLVSDRWLVSLLNFIWEAIIWKGEYLEKFVVKKGVYNLLDIITMSRPAVQCAALALVCEVARGGDAVAQLVTWRAPHGASSVHPCLVKRGSTIASLLAALFRNECLSSGISLDEYGIIQDLENPLTSTEMRKQLQRLRDGVCGSRASWCLSAADVAGSTMSKAFALVQLLAEDLAHKVAVADDAYNLYKRVPLAAEDEIILVLCSHYLTFKLNETWEQVKAETQYLLEEDSYILNEFLQLHSGWGKAVRQLQEEALARHHKRQTGAAERCLYAALRRVRLARALDALHELRRAAPHPRAPPDSQTTS